ncbi:glycogen synthase GlgA [Desulfatiglans anilini]|uniref:glycogen synthase GlgA n=1 Tax=Desulfatiglans anilini TaxID=90728 RepID=UPI00040AD7E7|nr:glycogen synthase GlgA [Desulfatiglans anilini]
MPENRLKVLYLTPEAVPFAKTGGLADVAGALPEALHDRGIDVRLMLPCYRAVLEQQRGLERVAPPFRIEVGDVSLEARVFGGNTPQGVPVYFVEREDLFDRPNLYGNDQGDYYDNCERFTFFAYASLQALHDLSFQPDIIHCHDWQTGLVPALLHRPYRTADFFSRTKTVFTIHNIGYQGLFPPAKLHVTGLPGGWFYHPEGLEYWGNLSFLKSGIVYADALTTVSPTYAGEIQTAEYGRGMEGILSRRRDALYGILNGVDYRVWDPATDTHLPARYDITERSGKAVCKAALIEEAGLDRGLLRQPLLAMISRLDNQKGLDLLLVVLDRLLERDTGLIILGSGDPRIQSGLEEAVTRFPGRMALRTGFDDPLAHRIMAGADLFLIPSRYEPCGLTQMYALKYGTVPVVRATGGLQDTIAPFERDTGRGNGFTFSAYAPEAFFDAILQALSLFSEPGHWARLQSNGMAADFSWARSAGLYLELYEGLLGKSSGG